MVFNCRTFTTWGTSEALSHRSAVFVQGTVVIASFIRDSFVVSVFVDRKIISTTTITSIAAVNYVLWAEVCQRPRSISENVDSIGQSTCGPECPTATTILGNVLISGGRKVVHTTDITPIPIYWNIFWGN